MTSPEIVALWLVRLLAVYAGLGFLFALWFAARGVERTDPAARQSSLGFRLVILPGVVALWPLLARRWWSGVSTPPVERNAHRSAAAGRREPAADAEDPD